MQLSFASDYVLFAQLSPHQSRDLLVAVVALGLGLSIFYVTLANYSKCLDLGTVRMIEQQFGRTTTRMLLLSIGGLCLVMGVYLAGQATLNRKFSKGKPLPNELVPPSIVGISNSESL